MKIDFPLKSSTFNHMKKSTLTLIIFLPTLLMAQSADKVTERFLQSFANAFNDHNVNAIMAHMTEDCVFEASAGPDANGEKFAGQKEVKMAFEKVFAMFPDAHWGNAKHFITGDRGLSEWIFTGTRSDGVKIEVTGCDIFTFRNGKIAIKNSYRKNRIQVK
jgi:ketosteroid isomerase-like protein